MFARLVALAAHAIMLSMKPPREIEAKYAVMDAALFRQLLALPSIGPFALQPTPTPEQQRNVYFDTSDWRLRTALYGFRIRGVDDQYTATLKGPATRDGATTSRAEWEIPVLTSDPRELPPGALRDRLLALTEGAPLVPTLTIQTTRQIIHALRDGTPALEVALDDVTTFAGGRQSQYQELEIELLTTGSPDDLGLLTRLLTARFTLSPQPLSKLARGLALLEASGSV
jgi:inorganic triphosphatase YgiF